MSHVAHLIRKDLRTVAVVAPLWIVLMAIEVAAVFTGRIARPLSTDPPTALAPLMDVLPYIELVVVLSIVSMVIHADPVLDSRAFWVTRPIPRGQIFAAKLIVVFAVVLLPALAAFGILYAGYDVPLADMPRAGLDIVLTSASQLLILTVGAALTPSLTRFVTLMAGAFVTVAIASLVRPGSDRDATFHLRNVYDPTPDLVVTLISIVGFCVVIHQCYRRRDWRVGAGGIVLIFCLVGTVENHWPDYRLAEWAGEADDAWTDPSITRLRLLDDRQLVVAHQRELSTLAAPLVLDGLPEGYAATPYTLSAQLTRPDGTVLRAHPAPPDAVNAKGEYHPSQVYALRDRWALEGPPRWNTWPTLLSLTSGHRGTAGTAAGGNEGAGRNAGGNEADDTAYYSGAYEGTFIYWIARQEKVAALRLDAGQAYADGPRRIAIVEASDLDGLCRATLEVSSIGVRFEGPREPFTRYYFADRRTGARLPAAETAISSRRSGPFPTSGFFRASFIQWNVESPRGGTDGASPCEDTDLIFLRTSAVGPLTRSLSLPDFHLQSLRNSPRP